MSDNVEFSEIFPLFRRLPGYKRAGGGWHLAFCPVHRPQGGLTQSLTLSAAGVLECRGAGCKFGDILHELKKYEPTSLPIPQRRTPTLEVTARYTYRAIDGRTCIKTREEGDFKTNGKREKRFRWALEDGSTLHSAGLSMQDIHMWEDPSWCEDERVWVTEGEKACEALRARQELAVCGPGASGDVPCAEALAILRGRDVIIWRDFDAPSLKWAENMKRALRLVAKSTRIVVYAGEPGDDAVEFFARGGNVEEILSGGQVVSERLGEDHYRCTLPSDYGPVVFDADEMYHVMRQGKSEMNTILTITLTLPGQEEMPYVERLNMYSASSKAALVGQLASQFDGDKKTWQRIVNDACSRIDREFKAQATSETFATSESPDPVTFIIDDMLPEGQHSILYALPASTKSYTAGEAALCIATGQPFLGKPVQQASVLVIDYETNKRNWDARMSRLAQAHGIDPTEMKSLPLRYYHGGGIPIAEQFQTVRRAINESEATVLIVDSALAAAGELFAPDVASRYFAALSRLKVTSLTIGQVPAADEGKLFGGMFWQYLPQGRIWLLKRKTTGENVEIGFFPQKASNGRWPQPFSAMVTFDDPSGPVTFKAASPRDVPAFALDVVTRRICEWMTESGDGAYKVVEIVAGTDMSPDAVVRALDWGKNDRFEQVRPMSQGEAYRWRLA